MTHDAQCYVMAWLARMIDARVIVEAGTYHGKASRILAEINPQATVYTADPHTAPDLPPEVRFYRGDFLEMLDTISEPIDFAYIDASLPEEMRTKHTFRYRQKCGLAVRKLLRLGGIMCFDDTNPPPWPEPFVELEEVKEMCQLNLKALKGFSVFVAEDEEQTSDRG